MEIKVFSGQTYPLGATSVDGGVNFAVYSRQSTDMELVLFPSASVPSITFIKLNPPIYPGARQWSRNV